MSDSGNLDRLAELAGIEPDYCDIWGNHHPLSDRSKRSLLGALDIRAEDDAAVLAAIRELEEAPWRHPLPPVAVVRQGERAGFTVSLPVEAADDTVECQVIEEGGARHAFPFRPADAPLSATRVVDGRSLQQRFVAIPVALPLGYHAVRLGTLHDQPMHLIVAPGRCYLPESLADGGKRWGITAHLYTLRSERNWGIGDLTDLGDLVDVCSDLGAALIGLNPLHALFSRHPEFASPYSPSSRVFLNTIYLDV